MHPPMLVLLVTTPVSSVSHSTHIMHKLFNVTVVLLYTGIDDLFIVKRKLTNLVDWQSLGTELGLLYPTLKRIEEHHRYTNRCIREMLSAWLQQQDNVTMRGVPSWSTLKAALINIGENKLADTIST